MEDLIPVLLFLLIVIVSMVRRALSGSRKKSAKTPSVLQQAIEELKARLREAAESAKGSLPHGPPGEAAAEPDIGDFEAMRVPERKPAAEPPPLPEPQIRRVRRETEKPVIVRRDEGRVATPARRAVDLKTAVIWSEILGPPLALRDRDEDFRA